MVKSTLILLAFCIGVGATLWFVRSYRGQSGYADPSSFIPISVVSKKRFFDVTRTPDDINGYPQDVYSILHASPDDDLEDLSCSAMFIRNWESLFFVRNETTLKYTISLPHDRMLRWVTELEFMLPDAFDHEKKFLLGRLCHVPSGTWFFEYHRGVQEQFYDNYLSLGTDIDTYLFITKGNKMIQNPVHLTGESHGPIFHCMPMQMTKSGLLYYQCTQIQNGDATTWFYQVDIATGQRKELAACTYRYTTKPTREC